MCTVESSCNKPGPRVVLRVRVVGLDKKEMEGVESVTVGVDGLGLVP